MKRLKFTAISFLLLSASVANAGDPVKYNDFVFKYSGLLGGYYGIMETGDNHNADNLSNRWVYRGDANLALEYLINNEYTVGVKSSAASIFKAHDIGRRNGDWRFYPNLYLDSPYGDTSIGYTFNTAYLGHMGAKEITFLGICDSNITYFLTNPNWKNGKHSVKHALPKSTKIMDDGRALKFNYITPEIGNTKLGFSYTPKNEHRRGMVSRYANYEKRDDGYAFSMNNEWKSSFADVYTSVGYGIYNSTDKELSLGLTIEKGDFNAATGYKKAYVDGTKNPITTSMIDSRLPAYFDNYRESQAWDISVGYKYDKFKTNLAYLYTKSDNTRHQEHIYIFSNIYNITKWFEVYGIGAYINAKGLEKHSNDNNKGYAVITGIGFRF